MVASRIFVFVCASTEQFPNKSVFIITVLVTSSNLQSMFFVVPGRVCLSSLYMGHWRTNEKSIQHQNRNCKLDVMYPENYN